MSIKKCFTHLHNHSTYSFGDGISQIPAMVKKAAEMGMDSLALTDHGYGHGLIEFYSECRKNDIKPILGCEIYFCVDGVSRFDRTDANRSANHLILLANNHIGYQNLIKILSIAATEGFYYKPKADYELLSQYSEGLTCLSACMIGPVSSQLWNHPEGKSVKNLDKAKNAADKLKSIFGENFYLEIQFHGMKPPAGQQLDYQSQIIQGVLDIHKSTDIPVICTNDAHYVEPHQWKHRNIIIADGARTNIYDTRAYLDKEHQYYLKSIDQMWEVFGSYDPNFLLNTKRVADKVEIYDPGIEAGHRLPTFSEKLS
jgi:DNA polymerase-3 subunit alpha